jgi:hypothetical protein
VLTVPANVTMECPANTETSVTGLATATDACGTAAVSFTDAVNAGCGAARVITRTWKAVDLCNNVATAIQTITVKDTIPPVLTVPANVTMECPANTETSVTGLATATDACGTAAVSFTDAINAGCGAARVITRTWKAVDLCNNVTTAIQTITVKDTVPPVLTVPANVALSSSGSTEPAATGVATATDACGTAEVSSTDSIHTQADGAKVITRTWKALDQCDNSATGVQTITVKDTIAPVLTVPVDVVLDGTASADPSSTGTATATDASGTIALSFTDNVQIQADGTKIITRSWQAVDAAGNVATGVQIITVKDTIAPVLTVPVSVVLQGSASADPSATGIATATDASGIANVTYTDTVQNQGGRHEGDHAHVEGG